MLQRESSKAAKIADAFHALSLVDEVLGLASDEIVGHQKSHIEKDAVDEIVGHQKSHIEKDAVQTRVGSVLNFCSNPGPNRVKRTWDPGNLLSIS